MNWWKRLKGRVRINEPLKGRTTFKIGGRAKFFIEPQDAEDLKALLILLKRAKVSFSVIGAGSNLLIGDKGVARAVIALNSDCFKGLCFRGRYLEAASAVMLNQVVRSAQMRGLSGLEFLAGIPGTLGGALAMNTGISEKAKSIGDLVEKVTVMDYDGNIKDLDKHRIKFGYRESSLAKYIILGVCLRLVKKGKKEINNNINRYLDYRRSTHGATGYSAGCIFKNPPGLCAGKLIDLCGLKGAKAGGAVVSSRHANFILNTGTAKAGDVLRLMDLIRKKVKDRFNVTLKPEIKIWR